MKIKKRAILFFTLFLIGLSSSTAYAATDRVNNLLNSWDNSLQTLEKKETFRVGDVKISYSGENPGNKLGGDMDTYWLWSCFDWSRVKL